MLTGSNTNSLDIDNDLNNIEKDNKVENQKNSESKKKLKSNNKKGKEQAVHKIVHNTRKSSNFKTDIVDNE
ncbi:15409_t:CDS:2, partial [Racocetra fulgida]